MSIKRITPREAHDLMRADKAVAYLDVRSVPEWEQGHPSGSVNIPLFNLGPGGMTPNADFLRVVARRFAKDARLMVGCKTGGRSQRAAELLEQHGFTQVTDVRGGYSGERGPAGELLVKGWIDEGLPTGWGEPYAAIRGS